MKILYFNRFCDIYDLSLFISVRAFPPSFRVLKKSQEREKIIRIVSEIREKRVVSRLLINLLQFLQISNVELKITSNVRS